MKRYIKTEHKKKLTAEEYRNLAAEHREKVQNLWKLFGKTGIVMLSASSVVVALCVAWFASNRQVSSEGMIVQSSVENNFELAAEGTDTSNGFWDEEKLSSIQKGNQQSISEKSFMVTGNDKTSIRWAITDTSHMANDVARGIAPGSEGNITFYIIPKKKGELTVTFNLTLTGRKENDTEEASSDELQLLRGHILVFAGYDAVEHSYSGWISEDADPWIMVLNYGEERVTLSREADGSLNWTGTVTENKAYPVTLYWIWPEIFGEFIFQDAINTDNRPILFPQESIPGDNGNPSVLPAGLYNNMCQTGENTMSNSYFKWASQYDTSEEKEEQKQEFQSIVTWDNLAQLRAGNINVVTYGKICDYYNKADQHIGQNIRYLDLRLDAK